MTGERARSGRRRSGLRAAPIALAIALLALAGALIAGFTLASAATPAEPRSGQRIDMKLLLIGDSGTEPTFEAWKAQLKREGVPYDTVVASDPDITDAKLADYSGNRALYQGVIVSVGNMASLSAAERDALAKLERTFGVRRLSDYTFPSAEYGLNAPQSAAQDGSAATLTPDGRQAFPYLRGSFTIDEGTYGHRATPLAGADFKTLVQGPGGSSYLGVFTQPDGREQMVSTVDSNQWQLQNQLLRHGMLNWVTRGVYLGHQRNYLGLQIDDVFIGDDGWDPEANATSYEEEDVIRMNAADVNKAVQWSQANNLRLDIVFNGLNSDPLDVLDAFKANKDRFGWINHTFSHPNLDCSTRNFIAKQINDNRTFAAVNGLPIDQDELVTGEHSGLANLRPGNPGTIDPPSIQDAAPGAGGSLAAGSYDYAVTASTANGETVAARTEAEVEANGSVDLSWEAICHATSYSVYRSPAAATSWSRIGTVPQPATAFGDEGPASVSLNDTGAAGTPAAPPTSNGAAVNPYAQNPNLAPALDDTGIKYTASDASKDYTGAPAPSSFLVPGTAGARAVPRWPTNVYYNTATETQQLDEYNWLYMPPPEGACQPIAGVTTCRTAPATWAEYVANEKRIMFRHLMGNDPRPHYFHEANIAQTGSPEGGILYKVVDALLADYRGYFADNAPLKQPTTSQIGEELARQDKWRQDVAAGRVSGYLEDGKVHVDTTSTMQVPLTGTTVGDSYGGQRSGWTEVQTGQDAVFEGSDPTNTAPPTISGTAAAGSTLTAAAGSWTGSAPIRHGYQWQRCDAAGANCADITGANAQTYIVADADRGSRLRVVVSGSNWIAAFSKAASEPTATIAAPPANTAAPEITGTPQVGKQLDASNGSWTGGEPLTFKHQWQRCDAAGASCTDIADATAATYTPVAADKGARLRVAVTATNVAGSASKESTATEPVAMAPVNSSPPTVSGVPERGRTLTAAPGSWQGSDPVSYTYRWQRCDATGGSCADITAATEATYSAAEADVGARLRVVVSATNGAGTESKESAATEVVTAPPAPPVAPANTAPPAISGTPQVGMRLEASDGSWTGSEPIEFARVWQRCDADGSNCADIAGATEASYTATAEDRDRRLRVELTATNAAGSAKQASATTGPVTAPPVAPANTVPPAISGTAQVGMRLDASDGSWTGSEPIAYAHQWQRCNAAGTGCADIAGAGSASYVPVAADRAARLRVVVTASNAAGTAKRESAVTQAITMAPVNTARPAVSGTPLTGRVLTASSGSWTGSTPISYAYRWQRCDAAGAGCLDIAGATSPRYTVAAADRGRRLRVTVTARNAAGSTTAVSQPTAVVPVPPANTALPAISGIPRVGQSLGATSGSWTGSQPISYAYRWRRCDSAGHNCANILLGATSARYTPTALDVGRRLRVVVSASNAAGTASATSGATGQVARR